MSNDIIAEIIELLLRAIRSKSLAERRDFAAEVHRIIVTLDDLLCDEFNLSRRGRGKKKSLTK